MKKLQYLLLFIIFTSVHAEDLPFRALHQEIEHDLYVANTLKADSFFTPYKKEVDRLEKCLTKADALSLKATKVGTRNYLKQLRICDKKAKKYDAHYVKALRESISKEKQPLFKMLIEAEPRILQRDRWVEKSLDYYKKIRDDFSFAAGEKLLKVYEKEMLYRQAAALEMANYEANVKILSFKQAKNSHDKSGKKRTFFVGYEKRQGVLVLIAENKNSYPVTLSVSLRHVQNYRSNKRMPYHVEIGPQSKQVIMQLHVKDYTKPAKVGWEYGWVMGRENVHHDNSFLYALPFKKGSTVIVSQGFNGKSTHSGASKYAVDFVADEGRRVYAARGGKVVATEASFNKGGFDQSFGKYANYIVIEHVDGTLGKYYHLKQHGVNVKIGQYVSKGQFIGLSGNTGYSSGPHLHFGVYKVGSDCKHSESVAFHFQTNKGVVDAPKKGDVFKVSY